MIRRLFVVALRRLGRRLGFPMPSLDTSDAYSEFASTVQSTLAYERRICWAARRARRFAKRSREVGS